MKKVGYRIKLLLNFFMNPMNIFLFLASKGIINYNDEKYIRKKFYQNFHQVPNLIEPKTFNEKMQWLKIHDRNPKYTKMVDKYEVKEYVANIIGQEYIIPTIAVYDKFEDIEWEKLPNQFVLKCTHDSGGLVICKDKKTLDFKKTRKKINKSLKTNYYYVGREWPYNNVKPRIIIEKYMQDDLTEDLRDYKFMCFNGKPEFVYITVKNDNIWENYYDMNFKPIEINHGFPRCTKEFEKPKEFEKMIEISKIISTGIPFLRVDLHFISGKIYFGETTFYDWGGYRPFEDIEIDKKLGELIDINMVKKNEK